MEVSAGPILVLKTGPPTPSTEKGRFVGSWGKERKKEKIITVGVLNLLVSCLYW